MSSSRLIAAWALSATLLTLPGCGTDKPPACNKRSARSYTLGSRSTRSSSA